MSPVQIRSCPFIMTFWKTNIPTKEQIVSWAKLGGETSKERSREKEKLYNLNPKRCRHCNETLPYKKRKFQFCNHSCSAKFNNFGNSKRHLGYFSEYENIGYEKKCEYCDKVVKRSRKIRVEQRVFCCSKHAKLYNTEQKLKNGQHIKDATLRYYLMNIRDQKCEDCGLDKWKDRPIPLDVHHKDGDSKNNSMENLQLLCKNCHALTDNYGAKNIGKGTRELFYKKKGTY